MQKRRFPARAEEAATHASLADGQAAARKGARQTHYRTLC
jgi:hypothetical protein